MSWIVDDIVERVRAEMGRDYGWFEWEQFCANAGLDIMRWPNLPNPAYLLMHILVLRQGMRRFEEAYWAWEEIGHHLTSCGNHEHWRRCLLGEQGRLNVAKFEHKAHLIRARLPQQ